MIREMIAFDSMRARFSERDLNVKKIDYRNELQEIIGQAESAKNRLAEVTLDMDSDEKTEASLGEALDALDDAIDILTDVLEEEE